MKRIDTATRAIAKFGTVNGVPRDGFTDGVPNTVPTTSLADRFFDALQEEVCRAIELNGTTLQQTADPVVSPASVQQLFDVMRAIGAEALGNGRVSTLALTGTWAQPGGLAWGSVGGLSAAMLPGAIYIAGRRIAKDAARILAEGYSPRLFTASRDTYIAINPDGLMEFGAVANGAAQPTPSVGYTTYFLIITNGVGITGEHLLIPELPDIAGVQQLRQKTHAERNGNGCYSGSKTIAFRSVTGTPHTRVVLSAAECPNGVTVNLLARITGVSHASSAAQHHEVREYEFSIDAGAVVAARAEHVIGTAINTVGGVCSFTFVGGQVLFQLAGLGGGTYTYTVKIDYVISRFNA